MIKKEKVQSCPNPIYCLQSHDVPFGTSDDLYCKQLFEAIPFCIATTIVPIAPPAKALPVKADFIIDTSAAGTAVIFVIIMIAPSAT